MAAVFEENKNSTLLKIRLHFFERSPMMVVMGAALEFLWGTEMFKIVKRGPYNYVVYNRGVIVFYGRDAEQCQRYIDEYQRG